MLIYTKYLMLIYTSTSTDVEAGCFIHYLKKI
jgi:hypothetical protein